MPTQSSAPSTLASLTSSREHVDFVGAGRRIGVFDSGLGGLSVLRALHAQMPQAELLYVADSGHAPYGEKDDAYITARCHHISGFLKTKAVDAIVVACNTATALAINGMRDKLPDLPVVGVEPGVKPAMTRSRNGRVGVLATPATLRSERFSMLVQRFGQNRQLVLQPCPGLAREIERGDLCSPALVQLIEGFCAALKLAQVDTVVLGCTHYPFVADLFQQELGPGVTLLDTAEAVARRTATLLAGHEQTAHTQQLPDGAHAGRICAWTSGDVGHLRAVAWRWLGWQMDVLPLPQAT